MRYPWMIQFSGALRVILGSCQSLRQEAPMSTAAQARPDSATALHSTPLVAQGTALDPAKILQVGTGFWTSKVLLTAVELGVFTTLSSRTMTATELGEALSLHPRGRYDFFDALVSMGFLERQGDGAAGKYSNTVETGFFMDGNRPSDIGGMLERLNARVFGYWSDNGSALGAG